MASLVLKPMMPNLDLIPNVIAASTPPRNVVLINSFGIFNKVNCHEGPLHPPEEEKITFAFLSPHSPDLKQPPLFFPFVNSSLSHLPSYKSLPFCITPQVPF